MGYAEKYYNRRSVSGIAIMLGDTAVIGSSTTQHCVIMSTTKAKYLTTAQKKNAALAVKTVLDIIEPHLSHSTIAIRVRGQRGGKCAD